MSTVQLPTAPQAPPPKKRRWPLVLGGIAIALVGVASLPIQVAPAPEAPAVPVAPVEPAETIPEELVITAEEFVDFTWGTGPNHEFCEAYFGLGDGVAFRAFEEGAGPDLNDPSIPTNRAVFDELVWRCVS